MPLILLAFLILAATSAHAAPLTWEPLPAGTAVAPSPRWNAGMLYDIARGRLLVFGGEDVTGRHMNDTWAFDLASMTWSEIQSAAAPIGRSSYVSGHWFAGAHDEFVIATGDRDGSKLNDIWSFDLGTDQWRQLPSSGAVPGVRYGAVGGLYPGQIKLWVTHGFASRRYSDTFYYDLVQQLWVEVNAGTNEYNPAAPHARCLGAGGLPTADHLVLYGGCQQNGFTGGPCPSRDAWVMDTGSGRWEQAGFAVNARNFAAMARLPGVANEGLMLLYGGAEAGRQVIANTRASDAEVDILNAKTGTWVRLRAAAATAGGLPMWRAGHSLATADDRIYMFGGQLRRDGSLLNDVWMLTGSASETPDLGEPAPRYFIYPMLHGLFMFLGWGVFLQAGWVIARYWRHKDPLWFKLHRAFNMTGVLLMCVGFALVYIGGARNPAFAHGIIGIIITILGLFQPINGFLRPHKPPQGHRDKQLAGNGVGDSTGKARRRKITKRIAWEWLHKGCGRLAVLLALVNISLGLLLVQAPVGVWATWFALLGAFVLALVALEVQLRRHRRAVPRAHEQTAAPVAAAVKDLATV